LLVFDFKDKIVYRLNRRFVALLKHLRQKRRACERNGMVLVRVFGPKLNFKQKSNSAI
jgi:hypothetical protein